MKQTKGNTLVIFLLVAVAIIATTVSIVERFQPQAGQSRSVGTSTFANRFNAVSTSSVMSITTSSSRLIATTTNRSWLHLSNDSAFSVYLSLDSDKAAVADKGILLPASSTLDFFSDNLYYGSINAITTGGTAKVLLTESSM